MPRVIVCDATRPCWTSERWSRTAFGHAAPADTDRRAADLADGPAKFYVEPGS